MIGQLTLDQISTLIIAITALLGVLVPLAVAMGWITAKQATTIARSAGVTETVNGTVNTLLTASQAHSASIARLEATLHTSPSPPAVPAGQHAVAPPMPPMPE